MIFSHVGISSENPVITSTLPSGRTLPNLARSTGIHGRDITVHARVLGDLFQTMNSPLVQFPSFTKALRGGVSSSGRDCFSGNAGFLGGRPRVQVRLERNFSAGVFQLPPNILSCRA